MEANNVEKRFNDWFTVSYDRLRNLVGRYGTLDEDNFHDTYLFVRKQVLNPEREITDYEAYFIGCYRKAFMAKFRLESKYAHPDEYFFLRCGEDADFLSPDDLNSCEKLVKDILNLIRRKFSYQEYRMFTLRFYESDFSFMALGGKHSVNHVFSSPTSIINFTSKKPSYDDTRRSGRDNELLQRAQNDL